MAGVTILMKTISKRPFLVLHCNTLRLPSIFYFSEADNFTVPVYVPVPVYVLKILQNEMTKPFFSHLFEGPLKKKHPPIFHNPGLAKFSV
jgi:hypothetical protein